MEAIKSQILEAIAECDKHLNIPCGWDSRRGATNPEFTKWADRRLALINSLDTLEVK